MKVELREDGSLPIPEALRARLHLPEGAVVELDVEGEWLVVRDAGLDGQPWPLSAALDHLAAVHRDDEALAYAALTYWRHLQP